MRTAYPGAALALVMLASCDRNPETPRPDVAETNVTAPAPARSDPEIVEGLSGRTARVALADGRILMVTHNPDGTAHMTGEGGLDMAGRWSVMEGKLCFDWPEQPRECWPYGGPLTPGESVRSTSDRGQVITTTLLVPENTMPAAQAVDANSMGNAAMNATGNTAQ